MRNFYIGIIVVLVFVIGIFVFIQNRSVKTKQTVSACQNAPIASSSATIIYSDSGFSPAISAVTSGGTLTMKNESSTIVEFSSDSHPIHTDNSDLNMDQVGSGQEHTVTVRKTGCFRYHDHLNPDSTGKILVK